MILETVREVLQDVYDLPALLRIARSIGDRRIRLVETTTSQPSPFARDLLERQGDAWGTRRDVIATAIPVVARALELLSDSGIAQGPIDLRARFDET